MAKTCEKCSHSIDNSDLVTVCEGKCAKTFHAACVGVTETDLCALSCNIIWICDACMDLFYKMRDRMYADATTNTTIAQPSRSVDDQINELKCAVTEIANTLAHVIQKQDVAAPFLHSTPVSSHVLLDGTREDDMNEDLSSEATEKQSSSLLQPPEYFSLYLTNIDKCATESDISMMVSRSLNVPLACCTEIVKLVPKSKNTSLLDFVSFKVLLNTNLKPLAMCPSTWPKGIRYREFVNRVSETWKPQTHA